MCKGRQFRIRNRNSECRSIAPWISNFEFRISNLTPPGSYPEAGDPSRRGAVAEGLVARAARRGQLVRVSAPDGRVSRAAAEARSGSAVGGEAAAPTSGVKGQDHAPRNRSAAEIPRSRRDWASGCVSPTGVRRDSPRFSSAFVARVARLPCPAAFTTRGARSRT